MLPSRMTESTPLAPGAAIDDEDVWSQVIRRPEAVTRRPALFLDRDGVIIEDCNYLCDPAGAVLIDGAATVIAAANHAGLPVVIVTNQGGIGLGYYGWREFAAVQERMLTDLAALGAHVDAVFASPHHPRGKGRLGHPDHPARKPQPGMLLRAERMLGIDLARSWIVGDHDRDLEAGRNAGLAGGMHVLTGHGMHDSQRTNALALADARFTVLSAPSIAVADALVEVLAANA